MPGAFDDVAIVPKKPLVNSNTAALASKRASSPASKQATRLDKAIAKRVTKGTRGVAIVLLLLLVAGGRR